MLFNPNLNLQKDFSNTPTMNTSMHELPVQSYTQEAPKIGRIPHWPVDTHEGNIKTTHAHLFPVCQIISIQTVIHTSINKSLILKYISFIYLTL
jgi:hypothetical protein